MNSKLIYDGLTNLLNKYLYVSIMYDWIRVCILRILCLKPRHLGFQSLQITGRLNHFSSRFTPPVLI